MNGPPPSSDAVHGGSGSSGSGCHESPEPKLGGASSRNTRHGLAIIAWLLVFCAISYWMVAWAHLKYVQGVIWPTDIYAFQRTDFGTLDVAIMGASRASFGLSPSALDQCLTRKLGRQTTSVNLARNSSPIWASNKLVHDLLNDEKTPRVIVLALGPESVDETTPLWAQLVRDFGDLGDIPMGLARARGLSDLLMALRPLVRGPENLALFLSGRFASDRHLRWMMLHHGGGQYCYGNPQCQKNNENISGSLPPWGSKKAMARMARKIHNHFQSYEVGTGEMNRAMLDILDWSQERGVKVALVDMPLHRIYAERIPFQARRAYRSYIDRLAQEHHLPILHSDNPSWLDNRNRFVDPDHLNQTGAYILSNAVCRSLLTPMLAP